ncbi:MAG TPA: HAD family hydrolase [Polyangiaceae bacterium]|jgi:putative hydrolase of the HAD superfamily|nr:HAD family hydrolase [Polyangiaceae bacterium]
MPLSRPHTVTFDCWSTLIHEAESSTGPKARAEAFARLSGVDPERAATAITEAWKIHQIRWHERIAFTGRDMTRHALAALGVELEPARFEMILATLEDEILNHDIVAIDGAREALERLAERGVRRALVCDTGFSPGRVVRQLLRRVGLLDYLEVTIFSEEVGVPKPHARAFQAALSGLGVGVEGAVHVGDLRRSDVAGARSLGMGTIRFAGHNDDGASGPRATAGVIDCVRAGCAPHCPRPEADAVIHSYSELDRVLGF